jgi:CubicO group peptidase (beta-lactamase class C family)
MAQVSQETVQGSCDSRFELVRREFERNFVERDEVGASVCIFHDGRKVVDLWGGVADPAAGKPWIEDTVSLVWSSTKGATSLCAHILADRGELDLEAPVASYWPEFAQSGKENIPVRMLLNHQSGLAAIREPLPPGAFYDWQLMTAALARETPWWEPGTRNGYHAYTFGWLVGEVIRRVSGRSPGTFFRDEVAKPLGLDFWIGLPEEIESRVAPVIPAPPPSPGEPVSPLLVVAMTQPESMQAKLFLNTGGYGLVPGEVDSRSAHAAEIPAAGGITNARGLAGMYAALLSGSKLRLVSDVALARMAAVSSATGVDIVGLLPTRFSLGFVKSMDNRRVSAVPGDSIILSEEAFGHSGFGGSVGFVDPKAGFSLGYSMNRMGAGTGINERGQSLVDAAYKSLGYTSNTAGAWI